MCLEKNSVGEISVSKSTWSAISKVVNNHIKCNKYVNWMPVHAFHQISYWVNEMVCANSLKYPSNCLSKFERKYSQNSPFSLTFHFPFIRTVSYATHTNTRHKLWSTQKTVCARQSQCCVCVQCNSLCSSAVGTNGTRKQERYGVRQHICDENNECSVGVERSAITYGFSFWVVFVFRSVLKVFFSLYATNSVLYLIFCWKRVDRICVSVYI